MKNSGKPDDRKGQVRFDAAGAGNGFTVTLVRHRQTKETATDRRHLRNTAPVLDPTVQSLLFRLLLRFSLDTQLNFSSYNGRNPHLALD
jgi:hypothetical protein